MGALLPSDPERMEASPREMAPVLPEIVVDHNDIELGMDHDI